MGARKVCSDECSGGRHSGSAPYSEQCVVYRRNKSWRRSEQLEECVVTGCHELPHVFSTGFRATMCPKHQRESARKSYHNRKKEMAQ